MTGYILLPGTWAKAESSRLWNSYIALVGVAEENERLRAEHQALERSLALAREDQAELQRLRALLGLKASETWNLLGTRVLAGRFGPAAALETIMIDRGYATGASPGTPLITSQGLLGRVFRASAHIASVSLLTDQTFRVAVNSAEGRIPGIIAGNGARSSLEFRYVAPNAKVAVGEILVTSGLDGSFPKGIPVARVLSVEPGAETLYQHILAEPLAAAEGVEEALLLIAPENWPLSVVLPDVLPSSLREKATLPEKSAASAAPAAQEGNSAVRTARSAGR